MSIRPYVLALAAFSVLSPAAAQAQEAGLKAGIDYAVLTPEDNDPFPSWRPGFVAGGWVRLPAASRFSFQAEGLYAEKGMTFDLGRFGLEGTSRIRLRYVEFPLLARGDFGAPGAGSRVFVVGGVAPAVNVSARATSDFDSGTSGSVDIGDDIKPFDLGLVAGVGVAFGRGVAEFRYTHGLLHINEDDNGDDDRIKNRALSLTFGVRFGRR